MGKGLVEKLLASHLVSGSLVPGEEIAISIDQTLTQDATGTLVYLELEAMGIKRVATELSVNYVDHNTLQTGFESADDHLYLKTVAARYGIYFSPPGNGICHQVHLERFGVPGKTLLGSDSHTPTAGGLGMMAIGAGGLDVALAMAGRPFFFFMPEIIRIDLIGRLSPWVVAKDVILEVLRRLSVTGGVGKILEYGGAGVKGLSVPARSTIANMGAELGATFSIFPSDEETRRFLRAQGRERDWTPLGADGDAHYGGALSIDLSQLEPLLALPHSPDNVRKVQELEGVKVHQVIIGSCTNSSYQDLARVAEVLKGKRVHPEVSLAIVPGSRQVLQMLAQRGELTHLIASGARVLEPACGPCIGMGQVPLSGGVTLRTFNRNFRGRSGTPDAEIYLCSPETAVASALTGEITDPRSLGEEVKVHRPKRLWAGADLIIPPCSHPETVQVIRGLNIQPLPEFPEMPQTIGGEVLIKLGDDITTDDILPAGLKVLPLRSNIPAIAEFTFTGLDPSFSSRATEGGGGIIVAGTNYGQGSSREHAALTLRYLGIKAVIALSFARIHLANLINFGVIPLLFASKEDYGRIEMGDQVVIPLGEVAGGITLWNKSKGIPINLTHCLRPRDIAILKEGGVLNLVKKGSAERPTED
ncbi:MAG: aconitate hydratase [Deltaproteobacteria bacterium]|nr:aconitate hydratase [Deltaproteobacteria bacterium]